MSLKASSRLPYVQFSVPVELGKKKRYRDYLHQWVLWAFVGPPKQGEVCRHLNDDPLDNRLENLEWGTRSENQQDIWKNGIRTPKTHCINGHPLEGDNKAPGNRCRTCQRARARAQHARLKEVV